MAHKYQENDQVVLAEDFTDHLPAGSLGSIFCQYTTTPQAYEVNFIDTSGQLVGGIFYEDELKAMEAVKTPTVREAVGVS